MYILYSSSPLSLKRSPCSSEESKSNIFYS